MVWHVLRDTTYVVVVGIRCFSCAVDVFMLYCRNVASVTLG